MAGKTVAKLAAIGAAVAGVILFWRKRHAHTDAEPASPAFPPAADRSSAEQVGETS
jgi:hypothetical protein